MRAMTTTTLVVCTLLLVGANIAQEPTAKPQAAKTDAHQKSIVPLVMLKPGETKELLLTTPCTVGFTRGGGFSLAEMKDGVPQFEKPTLRGNREYVSDGLRVSVDDYQEAIAFADSEKFASLKAMNLNAFTVTVSADADAKAGVKEMHLLDATCSGHCRTDFRILVVSP